MKILNIIIIPLYLGSFSLVGVQKVIAGRNMKNDIWLFGFRGAVSNLVSSDYLHSY